MSRRFFELHDDVQWPGRWHLTHPTHPDGSELADPWQFTEGRTIVVPPRLRVPIDVPGHALDFSLAGLSVPVVHVRVADVFLERAPRDVQLLPVEVPGHPDQYCVLVVTRLLECIDEHASRVRFWSAEDGIPEKVGQYSSVRDLHVDPARIADARVFRARGWPGPLLISEEIKHGLEALKATGVLFTPV
ncbi:hypothetical protein KH5H1_64700 [Corallococcus caeni]|uniref:imm11 family protein n=1 Tax=Corallococcus caeni TaxID=3082388 RepID=UPI002957EA5C|nr:hypothetical protein KH5H1_64700 [Corallococcus sp. KH5-1]